LNTTPNHAGRLSSADLSQFGGRDLAEKCAKCLQLISAIEPDPVHKGGALQACLGYVVNGGEAVFLDCRVSAMEVVARCCARPVSLPRSPLHRGGSPTESPFCSIQISPSVQGTLLLGAGGAVGQWVPPTSLLRGFLLLGGVGPPTRAPPTPDVARLSGGVCLQARPRIELQRGIDLARPCDLFAGRQQR
jgi:hypothetical protein